MNCGTVRTHLTRPVSLRSPVLILLLAILLALASLPTVPNLTPFAPAQPLPSRESDSTAAALPALAQSSISAYIGQDQVTYYATSEAEGLHMNNAAHQLAAAFDERGMQITRDEQTWGLRLTAFGRGDAVQSLGPASPIARENRIEYARGALTEWYVNGPFGLEQGFDVSTRPGGGEAIAPLTLVMEQSGDVHARLDGDGRGMTLIADAEVLRYGGLAAYDADQQELDAWLELRGNALLLRVEDARARYPLRIDPLIENAKLTASDKATSDELGYSIAISGDTIVVGAAYANPGDALNAGAAYVFVKPGGGWTGSLVESAKLTASDKAADDFFGHSVAVSGDTVIVGAIGADIPGGWTDAGAAYVYVKPSGGWVTTPNFVAKLTASDRASNDNFGTTVAISGDTIVVGANLADPGGIASAGAAYVFVRPTGGWTTTSTFTAKMTASDKAPYDYFGYSVAISGDTIVVGAYGADLGGVSVAGAAYVYVRPSGGWVTTSSFAAKLTASAKAAYDFFGASVAISGDTIVVGAYDADPGGTEDAGAAYVYVKPGSGWTGSLTESARLNHSDKLPSDHFGYSVAISGDTIVVGVPYNDPGGVVAAGAAYVFIKPGAGWTTTSTFTAKLTASDRAANDYFGYSVAVGGDAVAVGALYASPGSTLHTGAAYVSLLVPRAGLSAAATTFGSQVVGTTSGSQSITLTNTGIQNLIVSSITANGDFSQTNNCPTALAPNTTCTINVSFTPTTIGTRTGSLILSDNSVDGSIQVVSLSGTGMAPGASLSVNSLSFGNQPVGSTSSIQNVTLTNNGTSPLTINSISASGDFAQTNNCGSTLAATASCTIRVTFTPTAFGTRSGTLSLSNNARLPSGGRAPTSVQTVGLTGNGTAALLSLSPNVLNFGNKLVNTTTPAQTVTLSNSGNAPFSIASITTSPDYAQTNNCGSSLATAASCMIQVTFTPSVASVRLGTLTIVSSTSGGSYLVSLAGTGTTSPVSTPNTITFGKTALGMDSAPQSATLTNVGGAMLGITQITASGDFSQTNTCVGYTLPVGSSCTISVTFHPTATGSRSGSLSISHDTDSTPAQMSLTGTGASTVYLPLTIR